jgi:catalase
MNAIKSLTLAASLAALALVAAAPNARADDAPVATQIVDALAKRYGTHPGYRANHAKGIVATGRFTPSGTGPGLTRSPIFAGPTLSVIVRFSDAGGDPGTADASKIANPHGMSIKFTLPGGATSDIVTNALKFFTVATPEDFRDLQLASAESPPGSPEPTKLQRFLQSHPSVEKANATLGIPGSFVDEQYYGVDAFIFTNAAGVRQPFRYIIAPEKAVHLSAQDAASRPAGYLMEELPRRLAIGPATFHIKAQLAAPGDQTQDPTQPWPDDRRVVDLGVLTITGVVPDSDAEQKALLFLPGALTQGISPSDDPLIAARDSSYAVSYSRRQLAN